MSSQSLFFMSLRDIGFWLRSAKADAALERYKAGRNAAEAFDLLYQDSIDPWGFDLPQYRYQKRKYDTLVTLLPDRRFAETLDLGCGIGFMTERLAAVSDRVLGLDVSQVAISAARKRFAGQSRISFEQADVTNLPGSLDGRFDLVVVADVLYYLQPMSDGILKQIASRVAGLLRPGGVCLLANHFFFDVDPDSKLSRRIHQAFAWSSGFNSISEHRRPFYLVTLLERA